MDRVEKFFLDATRMLGEVQHKRAGREKLWEATARTASQIPDL